MLDRGRKRALPVMLLGLLAGCGSPAPGEEQVPLLDRDVFAAQVQPILADRCANPSCHGRPERALSLYAPLRYRADPSRTYLDEPLTAVELRHNWAASCAQGQRMADKPLADAVGLYHGGGVVFDGPTDQGYRTLRAWLDGGK